jgi:hypothetical protein
MIDPSPMLGISIEDYYRACVIGGRGAFLIPVRAASEFEVAIRRKLILEIASRPLDGVILAAQTAPAMPVDCMAGERGRG